MARGAAASVTGASLASSGRRGPSGFGVLRGDALKHLRLHRVARSMTAPKSILSGLSSRKPKSFPRPASWTARAQRMNALLGVQPEMHAGSAGSLSRAAEVGRTDD